VQKLSDKTEQKASRLAGSATMEALKKEQKIKIPEGQKKKLLDELREKLSPDRVRDEPHVTTYYRGPAHGTPRRVLSYVPPDMVVYPESKEDIQEIFKIASRYKVPLTPVGIQSTMVGSTPLNGGIVMDFMGMNKIHKIDTEQNYVVVEPGTTIQQVMDIIRPKGFAIAKGTYPSNFPIISTLVAWFAQHNFGNRMLDQAIGLEVCMPDGSILYTGSMAYGETEHWTEVPHSAARLTNLFSPHQASIGIITKAAIRMWPMLDKTALPVVGFNDFASAFRWTHEMAKSNMVDQTMIWCWVHVGGIEFQKSARYLDYVEAKMKYKQEEVPEDLGLFNCYAFAGMRGYEEEIAGAVKVAERMAKKHGGTYLSEEWMAEHLPNTWQYFSASHKDFRYDLSDSMGLSSEGGGFSIQYMGDREEIIRMYEGSNQWFRKMGWNNWRYYTRMFNGGQTPWLRYMPNSNSANKEEIKETVRIAGALNAYILENYEVNVQNSMFYFNDPDNPEEVRDRAKPIRRLMRAVQKEFDPESILSPAIKKYTLV
jgi:FAD/FMN-containing dehydrogenase